jgi:bacteriocin-like protein
MIDEKETKLSQDELKQVAGGTPTAKELSLEELSQVTGGASDIFAKLGDIKGETLDDKHKDEIEVLNYNLGLTSTNPSSK